MHDHVHVRVDLHDAVPGGLGLGPADVGLAVDDLALQVGLVDHVEVHDAERAHARGGQVQQRGGTQAAGAHAEHLGVLEPLLPGHPDVRDDQMARVAADLVHGQLSSRFDQRWQRQGNSPETAGPDSIPKPGSSLQPSPGQAHSPPERARSSMITRDRPGWKAPPEMSLAAGTTRRVRCGASRTAPSPRTVSRPAFRRRFPGGPHAYSALPATRSAATRSAAAREQAGFRAGRPAARLPAGARAAAARPGRGAAVARARFGSALRRRAVTASSPARGPGPPGGDGQPPRRPGRPGPGSPGPGRPAGAAWRSGPVRRAGPGRGRARGGGPARPGAPA